MRFITAIVFISSLFSQSDHCHSHPNLSSRSIYNIGDTLLNRTIIEDQDLFDFDEIKYLKEEIKNKRYHRIGQMWLVLIFQIWYFRFMNIKIN